MRGCVASLSATSTPTPTPSNEFFTDIVPYIDQISGFKRSFNFIYSLHWQFCQSQNNREKFIKNWQKENDQFKKENPYERQFLFLLTECDFLSRILIHPHPP
jgi:hypothetical protein